MGHATLVRHPIIVAATMVRVTTWRVIERHPRTCQRGDVLTESELTKEVERSPVYRTMLLEDYVIYRICWCLTGAWMHFRIRLGGEIAYLTTIRPDYKLYYSYCVIDF